MDTLPTELVEVIVGDTIGAVSIVSYDIIIAIELTCRRFYKAAKRFRRATIRDPIGYYLEHKSPTGVKFVYSLRWPWDRSLHVSALMKNTPEVVEEVFRIPTVITSNNLKLYITECLYEGFMAHMMLGLKYGYQSDIPILAVAADHNRPEMLLKLLDHMPGTMGDRFRAIETTIMHLFRNLSLFKMIDLGLRLKQIPGVDPRYISVVIYSIYKHSSMREEPEFIIRWILDNLAYQPMVIPVRESYTRINSMLRQHRFKLIRDTGIHINIERLLNVCL